MDKKTEHLKIFFRVANASYDFVNAIQLACNKTLVPNKMHQLNKQALEEIEKQEPDLSKIDNILMEMQSTAGQPHQG